MRDYLLAVRHEQGNWSLEERLDNLSRGAPDERTDGTPGSGRSYSWFSHRARRDLTPAGGLFTGFEVDEQTEVFCSSSAGWRRTGQSSPRTELPGCSLRVRWTDGRLAAHGDLCRMMLFP